MVLDDLAPLAATAAGHAAAEHLTLIPAVPERDYGPEVRLGPADLDLPAFLELAGRLGGGLLYLRAVPFDPASDEDPPADLPAHLVRHKGQTGQLTAAFAANGIVHFWEQRTSWYTEWQDLIDEENQDDEDQDDGLSDQERARVAAELADTIVADPQFRAARPSDRSRLAHLAIPPGTDRWAGYDAASRACARAREMTEEQYEPIKARLDDLAAELLASEAYQQASSPAARKQAAELFLIPRAAGFWPPALVRDELYARAQRLAKTPHGPASELF